MFFVVLLFFREPRKPGDAPPPSIATVARNFCVVVGNYRLVLPVLLVALLLRIGLWVYPDFNVPWWIWAGLLLLVLAGISRFMWFLVLFTGYWVVFWQQYISLPGYIHGYINPHADVEIILVTDGLTVICLTLVVNLSDAQNTGVSSRDSRHGDHFRLVVDSRLPADDLGLRCSRCLFWHWARSFSSRVITNIFPGLRLRDSRAPTWDLRFCRSGLVR